MPDTAWLSEADVRLDDLLAVVAETTDLADYPLADRVEQNVPIYESRPAADREWHPAGRVRRSRPSWPRH